MIRVFKLNKSSLIINFDNDFEDNVINYPYIFSI